MGHPLTARESAVPNASFRAALEKVLDGERVVLATVIARIRIACSLGSAVAIVLPLYFNGAWRSYSTSLIGLLAHLSLSVVIWRMLKTGRLVKSAGWVVPLFDVPFVALGQIVQTPKLPIPWMGMVNTPAMMFAFMALSVLSLSRPVIVLTSLIALGPILYRAWFVSLTGSALGLTLMSWAGIAAVQLALVGRVRGLVHSSRAQDLLGKYVIGRRLGVGGMAEVFEATYSPEGGFERRVAVKRILPSFAQNKEAVALFRQEAEVGAMLAHPGVVQVLDFGTHQGTSFLAMEYIDGVSLKDVIDVSRLTKTQIPIAVVAHIAWQLTEALDYIHSRASNTGRQLNLVHRDLNPPNIMLTSIGDAKLADFGIALLAGQERLTAAGVMRGKLGYAAPEQIRANDYDHRADLFALGITLYECLVGARLFRAANEAELMRAVLEAPLEPPMTFRPDVPPQLNAIVMGLLERDLALRTPSASELRRQLLELPRELLDLGRRLLAAEVANARSHAAELSDLHESGSSATDRASLPTRTVALTPEE